MVEGEVDEWDIAEEIESYPNRTGHVPVWLSLRLHEPPPLQSVSSARNCTKLKPPTVRCWTTSRMFGHSAKPRGLEHPFKLVLI